MNEDDRAKIGLKERRQVLGDEHVDRTLAGRSEFNAEFQRSDYALRLGKIWTRPGLDERTRRLIVLATMIALARDEEFKMHPRAALEHGVSKDDLKEVLLQSGIYCGLPAANGAFHLAEEVFAALD